MTKNKRLLISAGPTREYIDDVRYLSNASSGKMGIALAIAAQAASYQTTLILGPVTQAVPSSIKTIDVVSAEDMATAVYAAIEDHDIFISAAAVSDYRPAQRFDGKLKSKPERMNLELVSTPDILLNIGEKYAGEKLLIGFALEAGDPQTRRDYALKKLDKKHLTAIVLNSPKALHADDTEVTVFTQTGNSVEIGPASKSEVATHIIALLDDLELL